MSLANEKRISNNFTIITGKKTIEWESISSNGWKILTTTYEAETCEIRFYFVSQTSYKKGEIYSSISNHTDKVVFFNYSGGKYHSIVDRSNCHVFLNEFKCVSKKHGYSPIISMSDLRSYREEKSDAITDFFLDTHAHIEDVINTNIFYSVKFTNEQVEHFVNEDGKAQSFFFMNVLLPFDVLLGELNNDYEISFMRKKDGSYTISLKVNNVITDFQKDLTKEENRKFLKEIIYSWLMYMGNLDSFHRQPRGLINIVGDGTNYLEFVNTCEGYFLCVNAPIS